MKTLDYLLTLTTCAGMTLATEYINCTKVITISNIKLNRKIPNRKKIKAKQEWFDEVLNLRTTFKRKKTKQTLQTDITDCSRQPLKCINNLYKTIKNNIWTWNQTHSETPLGKWTKAGQITQTISYMKWIDMEKLPHKSIQIWHLWTVLRKHSWNGNCH